MDRGRQEVLGRDGAPAQSPQEGELARVRHSVRERPLEQALSVGIREVRRGVEPIGELTQDRKEPLDLDRLGRAIRQDVARLA